MARSAGWPRCPTATGTPASCRRRYMRSRAARCAPPAIPDQPGEVAVARCCHARAPGWCSTGRRWSPAAPAAWPSSSSRSPRADRAAGDVRLRADRARAGRHPADPAGNSTAEIAERLVASAHSLQQYLKSVFDKTGVRSRRDPVGKVFFTHYEPRQLDNERRAPGPTPCVAARPIPARRTAGRARTALYPPPADARSRGAPREKRPGTRARQRARKTPDPCLMTRAGNQVRGLDPPYPDPSQLRT
jgi:hypothetical protein